MRNRGPKYSCVLLCGVVLGGLLSSGSLNAQMDPLYGLTFQRIDGNRYIPGQGSLSTVTSTRIPLPDQPTWVVGMPFQGGSVWVTTLRNGSVQGFYVQSSHFEAIEAIDIQPRLLPVDMPPLLQRFTDQLSVLDPAKLQDPSLLTHPVSIGQDSLYVSTAGELIYGSGRLDIQALPDARVVGNGMGQWAVLAGGTDQRYLHNVLGDGIEASRLVIVEVEPTLREVLTIELPQTDVIEGIAPIWTDLDGDDGHELIVTMSNGVEGGQIVVLNQHGEEVSRGPGFGRPNRWRHPIAVAPFAPSGDLELAVVRTPHIGGVVEFYHLQNDQLHISATLAGFTSHVLGSRNLDMGLAGDFNGDGQPELVLPSQDRMTLAGIQRVVGDAQILWEQTLPAPLITNLSAVQTHEGLVLAAGVVNQELMLWLFTSGGSQVDQG